MMWLSELKYQVLRLVNELMKRFDWQFLYRARVGIKGFNNRFGSDPLTFLGEQVLDPGALCLGMDALKDAHTLIGTPIAESPHYDFIKRLSEGEDIEGSDYMRRMSSGTLDERFAVPAAPRRLRRFRERFEKRLGELERGEMRSIVAYRLGDRWYIKDGKHRASLACLMGRELTVRVVDPDFLLQGTRARQRALMAREADAYTRQLAFVRDAERQRGARGNT